MGMTKFRIVARHDPEFHQLKQRPIVVEPLAHPRCSSFGMEYYPLVLGDEYADRSFFILDKDVLVASVVCGTDGRRFSQFGAPIEIQLLASLDEKQIRHLVREVSQYFALQAVGEISFELADEISPCLSPVGETCLAMDAKPITRVSAIVDLTLDEQKIKSALRKSYRSLVNWGKNNLSLEYVNSDHPSRAKFDEYQQFHRVVSGRVTRGQDSWDAMYKAVQSGFGELSLGYLSGVLVSATLIIDGGKVSIYASGVYDRTKFEFPLAHWILYNCIFRAKERGMRTFELGNVESTSNPSQKEKSISVFKRGFASHLVPTISWIVPICDT